MKYKDGMPTTPCDICGMEIQRWFIDEDKVKRCLSCTDDFIHDIPKSSLRSLLDNHRASLPTKLMPMLGNNVM